MKRIIKRFEFTFVIFAIFASIFTGGCGGNVVVDQDCGEMPQSTVALRKEWDEAVAKANADAAACVKPINEAVQKCIEETGDNVGCPKPYFGAYHSCDYQYVTTINGPAEERCGVQVYDVPEGIAPEDYVHNVSFDDFDGDGMSNFEEFLGKSDPCEPNSIDVCKTDGERDSDGDGMLDADDPAPFCPGDSPVPCV